MATPAQNSNPTLPAATPVLNTSPSSQQQNNHAWNTNGSSHRLASPTARTKLHPPDEHPQFRLHEAPASPVNISPPRPGIREAEVASIREASSLDNASRGSEAAESSTQDGYARREDSIESLPIRPKQSYGGMRKVVSDDRLGSRASSWSNPRIEEEEFEDDAQQEETPGLRYHAFDDAPKKKTVQNRVSHGTTPSVGSSSSGENRSSQNLGVPRPNGLQRPASIAEIRGRTLSPLSANGSDRSSPRGYGRDHSSARSPSSRPTSYIDLLASVPYSQQIAPGAPMNNTGLQGIVGSAASLLDTRKTLEMYRANLKKTTQPDIQYEFAMFMINAAKETDAERDGINPTELLNEAKDILQKLADRAYPFAQYYLGDGYFSGVFNKDKPNYDKAFHLFVGASKHGHAEAGYRAALCYEFGWGTAKSYPKAVQFYRQAASKNHPGAATRLGMACLRGDMGLGKNGYREGLKWLKRAQESADFLYNAAPFELGLMHLTGFREDVFKDEAYAAQLLTQAAELGHVQANFMMGQAYENGLYGCPRDAALSVHFYNGAATKGHPEAMMALCAWYLVGADPILQKDEGEAYAWAKSSAEAGFPKAEYAVGYFTEMGIGCRRDPLEANVWYVRAADKGNETAMQRLTIIRQASSANGGSDVSGIPMTKAEAKSKELAAGGKKKVFGIF